MSRSWRSRAWIQPSHCWRDSVTALGHPVLGLVASDARGLQTFPRCFLPWSWLKMSKYKKVPFCPGWLLWRHSFYPPTTFPPPPALPPPRLPRLSSLLRISWSLFLNLEHRLGAKLRRPHEGSGWTYVCQHSRILLCKASPLICNNCSHQGRIECPSESYW